MRRLLIASLAASTLMVAACQAEPEVTEAEAPILNDPVDTGELATSDMAVGAGADSAWDTNRDGLFQEAEYSAWRDRGYGTWDTNADNRLTQQEFEGGWTQAGLNDGAGVFGEWDNNSDGFLDSDEWFSEDEWNTSDANDSGVLEQNEFGYY